MNLNKPIKNLTSQERIAAFKEFILSRDAKPEMAIPILLRYLYDDEDGKSFFSENDRKYATYKLFLALLESAENNEPTMTAASFLADMETYEPEILQF